MNYTNEMTELLQEAEKYYVENCKMVFYDDYKTEIGALKTYNDYTNLCLLVVDEEDNEIHRVTIKKHYRELPASMKTKALNYILHKRGILRWRGYGLPSDQREYDNHINSLKKAYDEMLNYEWIEPIDNIYSDEYALNRIVDTLIGYSAIKEAEIKFSIDYDYFKNNYRFSEGLKSCLIAKFTCGGITYEIPRGNEYNRLSKMSEVYTALVEEGFNFNIVFDMKKEDEERLKKWKFEMLRG